jgi:hypothetical protein
MKRDESALLRVHSSIFQYETSMGEHPRNSGACRQTVSTPAQEFALIWVMGIPVDI